MSLLVFYLLLSVVSCFDRSGLGVKAVICQRPDLVEAAIASEESNGPAAVVVVNDVTTALQQGRIFKGLEGE